MRKMSNRPRYCPRCAEPDLYLFAPDRTETITTPRVIVRCAECGWNTIVTLPLLADDFDKAIAAAIEAAAQPAPAGDDAASESKPIAPVPNS